MPGKSCWRPDIEWMLLGRSLEMPVVGGIPEVPLKPLISPGEGAAALGLFINIEGEKRAEEWGGCEGLLAEGSRCPSVVSSSGAFLRFLRAWDSFSALSRTTLAILSNSPHRPSIRLMLPLDSSETRVERKLTTTFISLTSERARPSFGFWRILAKRVTSAETG